ncbi:hypothetical protein [Streptomyces sp. S.PNR 29]|uniref:hypothetical protein n=1 Tax=Streptomyces sp. S.PNR 29 TaxID=2973805 RepID=UPI0025B23D40|nr:hypothetical protein [Streptomyces sp. S.PNR 29]MDN0197855.1 hypothetical protein [Streptomyces sp. S.PNR 29]
MNCSSRLLCVLYLSTSTGLAWIAVLEYRYGPWWAACLFGAASLVPVVAAARETVIRDQRRVVVRLSERVARARGHAGVADVIVSAELGAACCERWWTSLGTDHDATCAHRARRSSAA